MLKAKLRPTDTLFSKIIRAERPICEMCKVRSSSQVHHYYGRGNESVRFDEDNIVAVCFTCHRVFHEDVDRGRLFMFQKLGQRKLDLLTLRKNLYKKRDDKMDLIWIKQKKRGNNGKN